MAGDKQALVDLVYRCPRDIAVAIGYDKLTDLHNRWIRDMVFGEGDHTLQAHRGSYKTTCLSIAFAFIMVLFPSERVIFMRKTDADVAEVLTATASILRSGYFRAMVKELYGVDLDLPKATYSEVSTNLRQGVSGAAQLVGLGCGGSLTGKHADRVFTDDIINVKDRVSGAERERIKLIYQELQNIRNRGGRIYNTGTPWHKDDAFSLMPDIERWDCYSTGLISREELAGIEASMSVSLFAANYKLKHIADEEAMFSEPRYFSDPSDLAEGIAHVDAAYGGADGTAFTCLSMKDGEWRAYIRLWRGRHVDDCLPEILRTCKALRVGSVWVETNADKGYLRKKILASGHPCVGYSENTNKFIKISTHLKAEWPRLRLLDCDEYPLDADAANEVLDYNENAAHDDMPDSMASALRAYASRPGFKLFKEGL
ncbi:hypothetical protein DMP07_04365 [Slackia faecicanis]|uniref:Terminase n=1 Tax=Slackia faecicanis TaxID=255723 RepID=A0A3N0AI14_9ACTN|nr:hypothetical protein [Slackia faecicanis]RNL20817.1 hypothetical protein DMP07_04365 [Slackia faecicanis]